MEKCELNGHIIHCEKDLEDFIAKIETGWGRPLHGTAKAFLFERMRPCFKQNAVKEESTRKPIEPTFAEKMSGKSMAEIEKDRKEALEREWERRRREALLHRKGE